MRKTFFLWFLLFIFLTTYNYNIKDSPIFSYFDVKEIEILGINNSNKKSIETKLEKIRKKNLIFLKNNDLKDVIKNEDFVNSLKIQKLYPDKVIISIFEDKPIGVYLDEDQKKYLLLENKKILKKYNYDDKNLPQIKGQGAIEKFSNFYLSLTNAGMDVRLIREFKFYNINRWDLLLKNGKLLKLPPENYEKSVVKFLEIYEKSDFINFKVFDFRIKNELIVK